MNFLAHAFLSGEDAEALVGNFMGDFVKGNQYKKYPPGIVKGILLHREIDFFTDNHAQVAKGKIRLRPGFGHFSAVILDIFYDHLLFHNWESYSKTPVKQFVAGVYETVESYYEILPAGLQRTLPYMIEQNWLEKYGLEEGIKRTLRGISRRSKFHPQLESAVDQLAGQKEIFNQEFNNFFPEAIELAGDFLDNYKKETGV